MKPYQLPASPPCQIALVTILQHDWDDVEIVPCDIRKGEHKSADFLKLNPRGQIPTLQDGDWGLGEAYAIQTYLLQVHDTDNDFWPADPKERARVVQVISNEMTNMRKAVGALYYEAVVAPKMFGKPAPSEETLAKLVEELDKQVEPLTVYIDAYKGEDEGGFLCGDYFTAADANTWCYLQNVVNTGVYKLDKFPKVKAWYETCSNCHGPSQLTEMIQEFYESLNEKKDE